MGVGTTVKSVGATAAVLALVYVGVNTTLRSETEEYAVFTVTFTPEPRKTGVHVWGHVEGVEFVNDLPARGPYLASTWIPRGAQASVNAQQVQAGTLACTAHLNGVLVDGPHTRQEIGSVRCYVNRHH